MEDLKNSLVRIANSPEYSIAANPWAYRGGTFATNGRLCLWVPMVWPEFPEPSSAHAKNIDGVFTPSKVVLAAAQPVEPLREWAGPVVWSEPCPACQGTSKQSEHVTCSFCDNDGETLPDARRGYLHGLPIDRNYLAMILEHWPEPITLRWSGDGQRPLYLVGETWLGGLMLMSEKCTKSKGPNPWPDAPRFPAP